MADKGWTAQVAAAAGVAAGIGAAQLGLGYGLGVVVWPTTVLADDSVWLGSLGWATWIAASSTVFGAVLGSRFRGSAGRAGSAGRMAGPWRFTLAAAGAIGALLTVALIALPARSAVRSDTFAPQTIAAGYALIGVLLGLVIAYWAVVSRPVAANLIATAAWLWALAVAAVVVDVSLHHPSATYLTSWQFADPDSTARYGTIYWPSSLLTMLAALIIGIVAAWPAARRGDFGIGAASSGAVGPLLVAGAFFVLAPQLTGALGPLESAYLVAPYAVLTGLAGSALTVAVGRRTAERRARRPATPARRRRPAKATGVAVVPPGSAAGNATGSERQGDNPVAAIATDTAEAETAATKRSWLTGRTRGRKTSTGDAAVPAGRTGAQDPRDQAPSQQELAATKRERAIAEKDRATDKKAAVPAPVPARTPTQETPEDAPTRTQPQAEAFTKQDESPAQPVSVPAKQTQAPAQRTQPSNQQSAAKAARRPTLAEPAATTPPPAKTQPPTAATRPTTPRPTAQRPSEAVPPPAQSRPTKSPPRPTKTPASRPSSRAGDQSASAQTGDGPASAETGGRSASVKTGERSTSASASPAKPEARSTVAPPPDSPPIAQINAQRSGQGESSRSSTAEQANPPIPRATTPSTAAHGLRQTDTLWVDDPDSAPPPEAKKRRFGRRSAPTDENDTN